MVNVAEPAVQTFGKYQILDRIATGGMAEIYKAQLEGIGGFKRTFAIKRVLPHLSKNTEYVNMLVDEAKVAGLLSHANIVQILDLGQVDDIWYIAMEYVNGKDLGAVAERLAERGLVLPVPHAAFIAIELLKGLDYAHKRQVQRGGRPVPLNIIHRDVSPANILIAYQGEVKLTDFGIARASLKVMETQAGVIKGRFDYMSPEQAAGSRDLDQRSDLFSVGVLLYQMLTGVHPFAAETELDTLDNVRDGKYVPITERNPDVPFALEAVVDRALRANRDERYMTAQGFKEALDKFFQDAGFLFTQDTLGTYIQDLFPESRARPVRAEQDDLPPDPRTEEVDLLEMDEGPTRVMDAAVLQNLPDTPAPAPAQADAEEETVIKPNALAKGRRNTTTQRNTNEFIRPNFDDAEAETVVGRIPDSEPFRHAVAASDPTPVTAPPSRAKVTAPDNPRLSSSGPQFVPVNQSRGVPYVVAVLLVMGAVLLGMALGGTAGFLGGVLGTQQPDVAVEPARLEVSAPPGAVVSVNGIEVGDGVTVGPNQPQQVEVTLDGRSWSGTVSVGQNQTRMLLIDVAELEPDEAE